MNDLLEIANTMAANGRRAKDLSAEVPHCGCGHGDWLNSTFFVYRGGQLEVAICFDMETALRLAFKVAAEMFDADQIGLIMDGASIKHGDTRIIGMAIDRNGEMLWKVEPYMMSGRNPMWLGAEVPDEFPLSDPWVAVKMHEIMKRRIRIPDDIVRSIMSTHPELPITPEHVRAILDCGAGKAMEDGNAGSDGIEKIQFYAKEGTARADVLLLSGIEAEMLL